MSKTAVIYWSGTGNTEKMAQEICEGIKEAGGDANLFSVNKISADDALTYDTLALGCPSMGAEVLEEDEFEPFFKRIEDKLANKKLALFGSYGWGDGEWMRNWHGRCLSRRALLLDEGLTVHETPEPDDLAQCRDYGKAIAAF